ncbi:TBC domain protein [Metarhizium album ARSEF 1941]|uniref:TBC domain protein n=1 Tax=Metarhizium album (strain ARSEF 1941) TaxID=1081103 RepID=A0A0B2WNG3_METAS|nr:TBC domain protein [Metarhizium album ARSEF 1941]KHN95503.1 TBC domain protein [Metarhizium album ARSEF 1941]
MDTTAEPPSSCPLQRSVSQHSAASTHSIQSNRSNRSATLRTGRRRRLINQPNGSASSVATSDKSLISFPSFSADPIDANIVHDEEVRLKTATQEPEHTSPSTLSNRGLSIVDSLTGKDASRDALFEDAPLRQSIPGALHRADDSHIERLISRHGAVSLVRQIAEDLAQRDAQIAALRRRADERERALRKIIRECGLSNMDLENRFKTVEAEMRLNGRRHSDGETGLTDLMSDAMQDTMATHAYGETERTKATVRASGNSKGTIRGWKEYLWGGGTAKRVGCATSVNADGVNQATMIRSQSSMDRRPAIQDDLFTPPPEPSTTANATSSSRASSVHSAAVPERKSSVSLASLALRLVAGGTATPRDAETRGRAVSASAREASRAGSTASARTAQSARVVSMAGNPKALMAMRRTAQTPQPTTSTKSQAQDVWGNMKSSSPDAMNARPESYGPVEMDAILPPESQPPTLSHIYQNNAHGEFLTDRFGFIYDQRRKRRQREAAHMADRIKGGRTEMLANGRTGISPNLLEGLPSPKWSVSSGGRPGSPSSHEERIEDDSKPNRWQDFLKIATFPTELLSHTPSVSASAMEVLEGTGVLTPYVPDREPFKAPSITPTTAGLVPPQAGTTTAIDNETTQPVETDANVNTTVLKEDTEPVKLLLRQLSDVHDALQRDKTVKWNDFLRKVRAERRREGQAAVAAAAAVAEARYETPAMILPETRVADGEIIGISGLGNKGKVGRAKWNEFKSLVLGGIPVAFRAKVWSECSGANGLRVPGHYEDLVAQNGEDDDAAVVSQIQMDIHRTLTDNIFFRKGPGVQKLNELLLAYSRRNKDVGYCQGMNLIAANLLLIMPSAEDAFWVLASIIESILPHGYYDQSLMASRADQQVLRQFVSAVLPKLSAHLDSLSIELEALTFQWFLSVFTDCLCAEALFRVWDVVLCTNDGSTFLFQIALALLKLNERNLLQCDTPAGVYTYINYHMTEHAISIDGLIQAGEALRRVVRREDIEQRRNMAMQAEKDMVAE